MESQPRISIQQPCQQSWQQMSAAVNGRYCGQCSKTVIDFTQMSNTEIIDLLSAGSNICVRIRNSQLNSLDSVLSVPVPVPGWRKKWAFIALLVGLSFGVKANTKFKEIYQTAQSPVQNKQQAPADTLFKTVKGKIKREDKDASPVYLSVPNTNIKALVRKNGKFKLRVPVWANMFIVKTSVFYSRYFNFGRNGTVYHIAPGYDRIIMGEIKIRPGQKFNKELLIRSARELGYDIPDILQSPAFQGNGKI